MISSFLLAEIEEANNHLIDDAFREMVGISPIYNPVRGYISLTDKEYIHITKEEIGNFNWTGVITKRTIKLKNLRMIAKDVDDTVQLVILGFLEWFLPGKSFRYDEKKNGPPASAMLAGLHRRILSMGQMRKKRRTIQFSQLDDFDPEVIPSKITNFIEDLIEARNILEEIDFVIAKRVKELRSQKRRINWDRAAKRLAFFLEDYWICKRDGLAKGVTGFNWFIERWSIMSGVNVSKSIAYKVVGEFQYLVSQVVEIDNFVTNYQRKKLQLIN